MSLRADVVATAQEMLRLGLVVGTAGNVSAREGDVVLHHAARARVRGHDRERRGHALAEGDVVGGEREPSSEWRVHVAIYAARPDVAAIVHTHSVHATAWSCLGEPLDTQVKEFTQALGGAVQTAADAPPGTRRDRRSRRRRARRSQRRAAVPPRRAGAGRLARARARRRAGDRAPRPDGVAAAQRALKSSVERGRTVLVHRPVRVVRHLPRVAVRVDEHARVAAPERLGSGSRRCARRRPAPPRSPRPTSCRRAHVVGERDSSPSAARPRLRCPPRASRGPTARRSSRPPGRTPRGRTSLSTPPLIASPCAS